MPEPRPPHKPLPSRFFKTTIHHAETPSGDPLKTKGGAPKSTEPQLPPLGSLGRYKLVELIGRGGCGAVYRARDTRLNRLVALKVPLRSMWQSDEDKQRFIQEAQAAVVNHPNLCPVHDAGEIDGQPFIAMALIEGESLGDVIARRELTPRAAAKFVRKIALALEEAHQKGIVHRDLKPDNVLVDQRGEPIVTDFGLARTEQSADAQLTAQGMVVGTPAYISPEQIRGEVGPVGPVSDVFSLGVMFYELLTGNRPFNGGLHAILGQVLSVEPESPSQVRAVIEPELEAICLKAMEKKPADRFASMQEFADALTDYLKKSGTAAPTSGTQRLSAPVLDSEPEMPFFTPADTPTVRVSRSTRVPPHPTLRTKRVPPPPVERASYRTLALFACGLGAFGLLLVLVVVMNRRPPTPAARQVAVKSAATKTPDAIRKTTPLGKLPAPQKTISRKMIAKKTGRLPAGKPPIVPVKTTPPPAQSIAKQTLPPPVVQKPQPASDREAATYVLGLGGYVYVTADGRKTKVDQVAKLPTGEFSLVSVYLTSLKELPADYFERVTVLNGLPKLNVLSFAGSLGAADCLPRLTDLPALTWLDLRDLGPLARSTLLAVGRLTELVHLDLDGSPVTDSGMEKLAELKKLQFLDVSGSKYLTRRGYAVIGGFRALESLYLVGTNMDDAGLQELAGLTQLTRLDLHQADVTAAGLPHLRAATKLTYLKLGCNKELQGGSLSSLRSLTELRSLDLHNTKVADSDLVSLRQFPKLETLLLYRTSLTSAALAHVADLDQVKTLDLGSSKVTVAGLMQLVRMNGLKTLTLNDITITDADVTRLARLRVTKLTLRDHKLTSRGLARLRSLMPKCKVAVD